jgi:hypothetical protein
MIIDVPSHASDQPSDEKQKKVTVLTNKPKATFHWPPDCMWPFLDHGPETDT